MAAGLGFKTFTTGEVLSAANVNGYLMQGVLVFADAAARTAAVTSPQEGQYSYLKDTNSTEYYDGANWVALSGASSFLGCSLARSADLTVPNNTETTVGWDTETFDIGGFHSTSSNTSRITIPSGKGGYYRVSGFVGLFETPTVANSSSLRVKKNGTLVYQLQETAQLQKQLAFSFIISLAATDYVEMFAFQNTGGTSTFYSGVFSNFSAELIGA